MLDWRPEKLPGIRPKHEKVVVIKNMFDPKEFEVRAALTCADSFHQFVSDFLPVSSKMVLTSAHRKVVDLRLPIVTAVHRHCFVDI